MPDAFSYDVFLSYNFKDKHRVRWLAERLRHAGLRVWFDEWNVRSGDIIALKVDEGLEESRVLLLCVSPNALASGWVALERSTAIHRDPSNEGRRFIPLLLADSDMPDTLRRYKYVDFREGAESAFAELLTTCRPESAEAPPPPERIPTTTAITRSLRATSDKTQPEPVAVLEHTLMEHRGGINCLAVSQDGQFAASGSEDQTIKLWDLKTGECRQTFKVHALSVNDIFLSPDTEHLVSCTDDGTISKWNCWSGERVKALKYLTANCIVRESAETLLAGIGGEVRRLNMNSGEVESLPNLQESGVYDLAFSQKTGLVLSAATTIMVHQSQEGESFSSLDGHSGNVNSVEITPDGRFAISGSNDRTVKIWNLKTGTCVGTLEGHQGIVKSVAVSPDGSLIASAGLSDRTVRLWDWKTSMCVEVINHYAQPSFVAFSPDGSRLLVGTQIPGLVHVYRLNSVYPAPLAEAAHRYVNAKVVLLGEGTVGKTSLAHRLIEDDYVICDRTHGMNVWRLDLPFAPDAGLEREALLWDLAGQEDYRLIHQIFLNETALALLLINPQKDDPFAEADDWLKALKSANDPDSTRKAARLLIFSQIDVGSMKLGDAKIKRFCEQYGFDGWLPTSAKTGKNCSDKANGSQPSKLKQLIAESIPWDTLPWTNTPRLLTELKDAMMAMRDKTDIRLVRFAELAQRMEHALPGEKFGESEVRTAVTLLANNGLARPLKFGDLVLLSPELLNGYAGAIIRAARAHTDEIGSVLEADIYQPDFDFTGVERLKHRPDEELLLRALVQTFLDQSLCIAENMEQGRQLVFPSQYRREKDIPRDPDIFVSYSFSGEWQTVWTTLVVRLWYSQEFEHRELWRNAAEFASGKGHTLGLKIDNRQGEGVATISLYFDREVPEELKAIFIEYVHRHLAKFGCEVSRDRRYVCPECGGAVKDLDAVRKRLKAKKDFITCQGCDERVPLIDLIEQRLKSDPVARKILAMDQTTTRELDTQALEQILIGHLMAIAGETNQIFRPVMMLDHGIDGEVEFKDDNGKASGKKIYVQVRSWDYYQRTRHEDGSEVFHVANERYLEYWISSPVDVYLVIRQTEEVTGEQVIRWMNVTRYLKAHRDELAHQIRFLGDRLDMEAMWKVRDEFFPPPLNH